MLCDHFNMTCHQSLKIFRGVIESASNQTNYACITETAVVMPAPDTDIGQPFCIVQAALP